MGQQIKMMGLSMILFVEGVNMFQIMRRKKRKRREEEARKKRLQNARKAPPPVDSQSLLKMANEKKDIPVKVDKKVKLKDSEFGDRPMTKQEKQDYMRDNEARLRREGKWKEKTPPPKTERIERKPEKSLQEEKPRYEKPKPRPEPGPMFHSAVKKVCLLLRRERRRLSEVPMRGRRGRWK